MYRTVVSVLTLLVVVLGTFFIHTAYTQSRSASADNQEYLACGCGCCESSTPVVQCLYTSKGDDLQRKINADKEVANSRLCPEVQCVQGVVYKYCQE